MAQAELTPSPSVPLAAWSGFIIAWVWIACAFGLWGVLLGWLPALFVGAIFWRFWHVILFLFLIFAALIAWRLSMPS